MTLDKSNKYLLPCYLDPSFMDKDFIQTAGPFVDEQITGIDERIKQRKWLNTEDLSTERNRWSEYINGLPRVLKELNSRKCISLQGGDADEGLSRAVTDILNNK